MQDLAADGLSAREAASRLRRNPYYVQKLFAQASNFNPEELADVIVRAAELDLAVKGGSKLPSELELDRVLADATKSVLGPSWLGGAPGGEACGLRLLARGRVPVQRTV